MELNSFYKLRDGNKAQMIFFPYLGGNAYSYSDIIKLLLDDVEVWVANPPGHFGSDLELISNMHDLVSVYYSEISEIIRCGSVFFGHSMGGLIAYFLAERMINGGSEVVPDKLFLSASMPPCCYDKKASKLLSDRELIDRIKVYNVLPERVLSNEEMMAFMMPVFRADYGILETAVTEKFEKIDIEAHVLWGENDKTEDVASMKLWKNYLTRDYDIKLIDHAQHMFVHDQAEIVASYVKEKMNLY